MSAPTLQAEGTLLNITTGNMIPVPPTHEADDILVACWGFFGPNTTTLTDVSLPTGWTLGFQNDAPALDGKIGCYWLRAASGTNPVTFVRPAGWDTGTDTAWGGWVTAIDGCILTGDPFDEADVTAVYSTANQSCDEVTVSAAGRLVIQFLIKTDDFSTAPTLPSYTAGTQQEATNGTDSSVGTFRIDNTAVNGPVTASTVEAPAAGRYQFWGVSFKPADPTHTSTHTPTYTWTPTATPTWTPTWTPTDTGTYTHTPTWTPTDTGTFTHTPTWTPTDTPTHTGTYTHTPTDTPTATPTHTGTFTNTSGESNTFTPTYTDSPTSTWTPTATPTYTDTPTFTWTPTSTWTPTWTPTSTGTYTHTPTDSPTYTHTPTSTPTFTWTPTATHTGTSTNSPTDSHTSTVTPTPDGTRLVFVSNRDGNEEIYTSNADGTGVTRLTKNLVGDINPAWSPGGTRIFFISNRSGKPEIWVMNSDGTQAKQVTFTGGAITNAQPDVR